MNRKETMKFLSIIVITAIITTGAAGIGFIALLKHNPQIFSTVLNKINSNTTNSLSRPKTANLPESETVVIETVKRVNPAVVAITISKNVPVYEQYYEDTPNPFGDFFGGFSIPQLRQKGTEKQEVGGGSGFLISTDGLIVTNRHVVADEKAEYTVILNDGKKYNATVIARDPALDLAVIKIDGSDFKYLSFGDSDNLQIGQTVIAIGNALAEFNNTVSVGVVSGLSRSITASDSRGGIESLNQLIQTDAAINPGNSGGPLLNLAGEVIGVNVAVAGDAQNIGFALSANSVKNIVESVKKTGKIVRPYIGIRFIPITEEIKKKNNLQVDYGVLVLRGTNASELAVIPGSPADKAGIVENDIILEIDNVKLTSDKNLASIIRTKKVGDRVVLKILSKSKEKTAAIVLEEMKI